MHNLTCNSRQEKEMPTSDSSYNSEIMLYFKNPSHEKTVHLKSLHKPYKIRDLLSSPDL